eukprot:scaffold58226_cov65-Phaeocystis_antarctica.AAC.2
MHLRLIGLGLAGIGEAHAKVASLAEPLAHAQRQSLRQRLLPRFLARQRRRRCSPLRRRRLPLRRSRDAQRCLLRGGEVAQGHCLATAPHRCPVGFGLAGTAEAHAEVARAVIGHAQRQPRRLRLPPRLAGHRDPILRLRLLPHLLALQLHRRCSPLSRYRLPPRRSRDAQRGLLCGGEAAKVHQLATATNLRLIGLRPAGLVGDAEVARLVLGHEQCQVFRLRLLSRLAGHRDRRFGELTPTARIHSHLTFNTAIRL